MNEASERVTVVLNGYNGWRERYEFVAVRKVDGHWQRQLIDVTSTLVDMHGLGWATRAVKDRATSGPGR